MATPSSARVGKTPLPWVPAVDGGFVLMVFLIGTLGFYIVYPLVLILVNSFNVATIADPPVYGLKAWQEAFSERGIWLSLWNSIKIGIILQIAAFPLGIFISWLLARTNIPFTHGFEFLFWVSFILPNLATTFGWILLLDPNTGLINSWLRSLPLARAGSFTVGESVLVAIRPEKIAVWGSAPSGKNNVVQAILEGVHFLGDRYEYTIAIGETRRVLVLPAAETHNVGEQIYLELKPEEITLWSTADPN